ncbi:MAG TPA: DUF6538 domain-containing protein, partial [Nitrospira sp.]|nr:DUF6538 domain-containing protein [Nitrospira sp.]
MATFSRNKRKPFYTRLVIPTRLRVYFQGKREVWRSLGTKDKAVAATRALQFEAQGRRLFLTLSRRGNRMTRYEIETLVTRWLDEALDEAEDDRATLGPITEAAREDIQDGLSATFDGTTEALLSGDYRTISKEANDLLHVAGLPALDHGSQDFARLCRRLLRAKVEYLRLEGERWNGEYREATVSPRDKLPVLVKAKPHVSLAFSVVLDKYLSANPRPARTANPLRAEFMRFIETIGGDKPIAAITKADVVAYKEVLQTQRKISLLTCAKHLSNLDALFKWACTHDYLDQSPARGLAPSKRQAKKHALQRRPFTDDELLT